VLIGTAWIGPALFALTLVVVVGGAIVRYYDPRWRWAGWAGLEDRRWKQASRAPRARRPSIGMLHILTLIMLGAALWVILSNKYDDDTQKWAFGTVGTVIGFWFAPR
jgi:hypothetical protein